MMIVGEAEYGVRQAFDGNSPYYLLAFAGNLKLFLKKKVFSSRKKRDILTRGNVSKYVVIH